MSEETPIDRLMLALAADDVVAAADILRRHPHVLAPEGSDACVSRVRLLASVRSEAMVDVLVEPGRRLGFRNGAGLPRTGLTALTNKASTDRDTP